MKILVMNGSPKKNSDTFELTKHFLKPLESKNEITIIHVIEQQIKPCLGCFQCWNNADGQCVIQDDQNKLLKKYVEADLVIFSFPLYCYSMPSHLKAFVDRTLPLVKMNMEEDNGIVRHETLVDFSKKKTLVISGCGFPDWDGNFEALRLQCKNIFGDTLTTIFVPETPLIHIKELEHNVSTLLKHFEEAGEEWLNHNALSKQTTELLQSPMIPKSVYLQMINQQA